MKISLVYLMLSEMSRLCMQFDRYGQLNLVRFGYTRWQSTQGLWLHETCMKSSRRRQTITFLRISLPIDMQVDHQLLRFYFFFPLNFL